MRRRGAAGAGPALLVLLPLLLLLHGAHAACPACPPPPARCHYIDTATVEECFYDIDNTSKDDNFVMSASQNYVGVTCAPGMTLDSRSLPALTRRQEVSKAVLAGCGPPADGYSGLLTRLNVTVLDELHITWLPPDSLAGRHFAGLEQLSKLVLTAANATRPLEAATDLLNGTPSLTALHLSGVTLPPAALRHLPASLTTLTLSEPGLVVLSAADLPALPRLRSLYLKDRTLLTLPPLPWPALRQLVLLTPNMTGTLTLPTGLDKLMLEVGGELSLSGECRLRELTLSSATLDHLPVWVAGCTRLTWLTVRLRNLTRLTGAELANMTALRRLKLAGSQLTALPPQLFRATRNLTTLDLSRNNITSLPSNIFSRLTRLEQLDLSSNKLVARSADALWPLSALTDSLRSLALHDNPLGDLCPPTSTLIGGEQLSILPRYKQLRTLRLGRTGARRVCADWRGLPTLQQLDLRDNDITELQWSDLQWPRSNRTHVWLAGNAVRGVRVTRTQYERGGAEGGRVEVELQLNANLTCDCTVYWLARARRERRLPVSIRGLNCLQPGNVTVPLEQVDVDGMVCDVREGCPSNCSCSWHAGRDATTADCTRRGLHTLPSVTMLPGAAIELLASNNSITILPSVEALPARLRRLDLRYNSLQSLPSLKSLLPRNRSLLLRGNPLRCACPQHWLAQLPDHLAQVEDAADVVCTDGRALRAAATASCGGGGGGGGSALLASGAAALVLLAVAALLLAALRPAARLRLKAALLARGLCPSWAAPDDDDDEYTYDAFLSYSHLDADVADELVSVLEAGPRPLRLCVHHRDWRVGGWIHAQIAESVARSRRTVILLSDNFAASSWARAEFREAYAKAMRDVSARLIVVVLGDAPPAGLDPELQHYVAHNTYVRWGEPAFWEKLRLALPPGRAPRRGDKPAAAEHTREQRAPDPAPVPAPHPDPAPAPPTPIVKFAQIDFPATLKPPKNETSACA